MITAITRGLPEILDNLDSIAPKFDLERSGLGVDLLDICTFEILENMGSEVDPDGVPWPPLSDSYLEWKAEVAPQAPMAVLHGLMKNWEQVAGIRDVKPDHAEMTYGVSIEAFIEAVKFTEGGLVTGTTQPPRPFYAITTAAAIRADAKLATMFTDAF